MTGGGVAVQIERSGGFEDAVKFDQADGHHREISHHVVFAEKRAHRAQQLGGLR